MTVNVEIVGMLFAILVGLVALWQARRPLVNQGPQSWREMVVQMAERDRQLTELRARLEKLQANYDRIAEENKRQRAAIELLLAQLGEAQTKIAALNRDLDALLRGSAAQMPLRQLLTEKFSLEELQLLAADLKVDWAELEGQTLPLKASSLIAWLTRRDRLDELTAAVKQLRPGT